MSIVTEFQAESAAKIGAPCLAFETWESEDSSLKSPQTLGAPPFRLFPGESVGEHESKPTLFPWCNE